MVKDEIEIFSNSNNLIDPHMDIYMLFVKDQHVTIQKFTLVLQSNNYQNIKLNSFIGISIN